MISAVYKIVCGLNESIYVGSSRNIEQRFCAHLSKLKKDKHENRYLQRVFNEGGEVHFKAEVLEECEEVLLLEREQYYIDLLKPDLNICPLATGKKGSKLSQETKDKMSMVRKGVKKSEETRRKMSLAQMGNTKGRKKVFA